MLFVNFKTYEQGTGIGAINLVKILETVADDAQIKIIPVVQVADIKEIVLGTKLEVWAQKVDPIEYGAHTGSILPEAILEDGASGVFLNHSEAKFTDFSQLEMAVSRCRELDLKTLVFAGNLEELKKLFQLRPTFVAYEPPELVGSLDTSVAREKPEIILDAVNLAKAEGLPLVVGAGIKSAEDIGKSLELGAVGVAVASDIVMAVNPEGELREMIEGFK